MPAEPEELPRMSVLEHLEELRSCLIHSLAAIFIGFLVCWMIARDIFQFLQAPVLKELGEMGLVFTHLTDPFLLYMKVAFLAGVFLSSPYVLYQVWKFVSPGLYPGERRMVIPFVLFTSAFFIAGGYFGYRVVFPLMCNFFIRLGSDFTPVLTVREYMSLVTKLLIGMGLVFELPVLIFFLSRLGIVSAGFLLRNFKYAVLLIFIIAAVITPTPDIITQSTLAVPMILLYFLGILVSAIFGKKRHH